MITSRDHLAGWLRNAAKMVENMTDEEWSKAGLAATAVLNGGSLPMQWGMQDRKNYIDHCRSAAHLLAPLPEGEPK